MPAMPWRRPCPFDPFRARGRCSTTRARTSGSVMVTSLAVGSELAEPPARARAVDGSVDHQAGAEACELARGLEADPARGAHVSRSGSCPSNSMKALPPCETEHETLPETLTSATPQFGTRLPSANGIVCAHVQGLELPDAAPPRRVFAPIARGKGGIR